MNFGKWIFVSFVLFAAFIATLVTICIKQDISLVSKNYYTEELAYQQQIQRMNNTTSLAIKPVISLQHDSLKITADTIIIEHGKLALFCPSDAAQDRIFELNPNSSLSQNLMLENLKHGMYRAKLSWVAGGKEFYLEEIINL